MTDASSGGQRDRSPAFPVIALEPALGKMAEFEAHFKRTAARPEKVGEAWGIKTKAYADRIAAALRYFGLLEYQGSGKDRSIVVSETGRKYLRAQQEELKRQIAKEAALRPRQIAKHWNDWGADRPADAACLDGLMEEGFSEGGARDFLKVYDATITYAKLSDSDKAPADGQQDDDEPEAALTPEIRHTPPKSPPPPNVVKLGSQHAAFPLPEGEVSLSFPANLSLASAQTMAAFVKLALEQAERQAKAREEAYQAGIAQMAASGKTPPPSLIGSAGEDEGQGHTTSAGRHREHLKDDE
jgi:hypothetical protein